MDSKGLDLISFQYERLFGSKSRVYFQNLKLVGPKFDSKVLDY